MAKQTYYIAIDIGTSKTCSIVSQVGAEGELKVLGTGLVRSQGMSRGRIEDPVQVQEAVKSSLEEAQRYIGRGEIAGVYAGVGGANLSSVNTRDAFIPSGDSEAPSEKQLEELVLSSMPQLEESRELLHVIPTGYHVDGLGGSRNPAGIDSARAGVATPGKAIPGKTTPGIMEVEAHVISADPEDVKNTIKVVQGCKVSLHRLVSQGLASAEATLTGDEKELGTVLVDIGGGTTDLVIYRQGNPWHSTVIPVGGNQFTNDLAIVMGLPWYLAEDIKVKWGSVMPESVRPDEEVVVPAHEREPEQVVKRRVMSIPLQARFEEVLKLVLLKVRESGSPLLPPGGLVITGGCADLSGIREMAQRTVGGPVRIAHPTGITGLPTQLGKPMFATAVGLLLWGIQNHGQKRSYLKSEKSLWRIWPFGGRNSPKKVEREKMERRNVQQPESEYPEAEYRDAERPEEVAV